MGAARRDWRAPLSERQQLRLLASQQRAAGHSSAALDDEAALPPSYAAWPSARQRAWHRRVRDPERYLLRWSGGRGDGDVGERRGSAWTEVENAHFLAVLEGRGFVGGRGWKWGGFSAGVPGRSGEECRGWWRVLAGAGIVDGKGRVKSVDGGRVEGGGNAVFLGRIVRKFAPVILPEVGEARRELVETCGKGVGKRGEKREKGRAFRERRVGGKEGKFVEALLSNVAAGLPASAVGQAVDHVEAEVVEAAVVEAAVVEAALVEAAEVGAGNVTVEEPAAEEKEVAVPAEMHIVPMVPKEVDKQAHLLAVEICSYVVNEIIDYAFVCSTTAADADSEDDKENIEPASAQNRNNECVPREAELAAPLNEVWGDTDRNDAERRERKRKRKEKEKERRRRKKRKIATALSQEIWEETLDQAFAIAHEKEAKTSACTEATEEEYEEVMDMEVFQPPIATSLGRKRIGAPPALDALKDMICPSTSKPPLPYKANTPVALPPVTTLLPLPSMTKFRRELVCWAASCPMGGSDLGHKTQRRHVLIAYDGEYRRCKQDDPEQLGELMATYRGTMDHLESHQRQEVQTLSLVSSFLV